jgi:hypothetical protein
MTPVRADIEDWLAPRKSRACLIPRGFAVLRRTRIWPGSIALPWNAIYSACGVLSASGALRTRRTNAHDSSTQRPRRTMPRRGSSAGPTERREYIRR